MPAIPTALPLRRPHSPKRDVKRMDENQGSADRFQRKPVNRNSGYGTGNNGRYNSNQRFGGNRRFDNEQQNTRNTEDNETWEKKDDASVSSPPSKPNFSPPQTAVTSKPKVTSTTPAMTSGSMNSQPCARPTNNVTLNSATKKLVPEKYLLQELSVGDSVLLSVEADAAACRHKSEGSVCLSMHERFEADYQALCEIYVVDCEADTEEFKPKPGDTFSYLNPEDGGWYRARSLNREQAALLDAAKVVTVQPGDKLRKLPDKYKGPEFCCVITGVKTKIGASMKCDLLSKTGDGFKVSVVDVETGAAVGEGEISRWLPLVEEEVPIYTGQPQIPEVLRPSLHPGRVLLVEAFSPQKLCIRPSTEVSQRSYDAILQDVLLYARDATPLKEPPVKGQMVVAKFSDGLHYRALCKRTNVKQNKYLLEYLEYGNLEISGLENMYPCPEWLSPPAVRAEPSFAQLHAVTSQTLTKEALEYLNHLKDNAVELEMTLLPDGKTVAESGDYVLLTVVKTNESVNRKVEELCKSEWKKLEERGGDASEMKSVMYNELEYMDLPPTGCELDVLDISALACGTVSGCQRGLPQARERILTTLTERMAEYCESDIGKEPYLPKFEEVCIAKFPPYPQWFRAVLLEHAAGGERARVCYVDYGHVGEVPLRLVRRAPRALAAEPALAAHLEIRDFPSKVTPEMLARAVEYMKIDAEGRGVLKVTRCERQEAGLFMVDAPGLLAAMGS